MVCTGSRNTPMTAGVPSETHIRKGPRARLRPRLESARIPFSVKHYRTREVVFWQGDPCDDVMYIEKGRVWLAIVASSGREAICGLLDAGAFMGEEAMAGHAVRRETATAMTETTVLAVGKAEMLRLVRTLPDVADLFVAHTIARHTRLEEVLIDHLLYPAEQRLAHTLMLLARCNPDQPCRPCALPAIPQEAIAEMIGTTRSRVNLLMGRFKRHGLIKEDHGTLRVLPSLLHVVDATRSP